MAKTSFAPQDLGRLPEIDAEIEPGVILWGRFCVVGEPRTVGKIKIIAVTDLHRMFGAPPTHRVELHLFEERTEPAKRPRLRRAFAADTRTQPQVFAILEIGPRLALVCKPRSGQGLGSTPIEIAKDGNRRPPLDKHALVTLASDLSALLTKLHASEVYGVYFSRDQLSIEAGHYVLDTFAHIDATGESPAEDVERILALLERLGGDTAEALIQPRPSTARELWNRARGLAGSAEFEDILLPAEPPFIGREHALRELYEGLAQADIAKPTAITVSGPRGVGKSRLLREFVTTRVEANDAIVLTGTWQPRSADTRGGLLGAIDQLPRTLQSFEPEEREAIRSRVNRATRNLAAIVTRSAPSLGSILRGIEDLPPLELSGDLTRHTTVITDLLRAIGTQKRPLVLVLDNLEMADVSSLAVLKLLTQPRPAHHTLVVTAQREGSTLKDSEYESQSIKLEPLTSEEIDRLLSRTFADNIADKPMLVATLLSMTKGFPLAIWANLRAWLTNGLLVHDAETVTWRPRPELSKQAEDEPNVRDLFGFRLAGAEPEVRDLVLHIAMLGIEVDTTELLEFDNLEAQELSLAINDLVERGIITRTPTGVRFPHDSIRELVLEAATPEQRRKAHSDVATLLRQQSAPVAQLAYHTDLGFDRDTASDEDFARLSSLHVEAGRDRLAIYDLERARWHLERALEHSREPVQRGLAAEALADVCLLTGDFDEAVTLYTALIAASDDLQALRSAGKAVHFLFFQSRAEDGMQLGEMALEMVNEPIHHSPLSKIVSVLSSLIRSSFQKPPHRPEIRDALCALYPALVLNLLATDPLSVIAYLARANWLAKGLRSGSAALTRSIVASMRATFGHYRVADQLFAEVSQIAEESGDAWARGICAHTWGHAAMLPANRYDEGQDMLDDAIGAFRETGDMSVAIVSLMMKALFGKDREDANTLLGWLDEALSMARRNAKDSWHLSIEAIRLIVLARQGRTDITPRIQRVADDLDNTELSAIDRILARSQLALAALEAGERQLAFEQAVAGNSEMAETPGVPEFCLELHFATASVVLERQFRSRRERKMLRQAARRLKRAARTSPRLATLHHLYQLRQANRDGDTRRTKALASELISGLDTHGNIYAVREAHRVLSHLTKARDVLAAAEHERIARSLGRRLGINDLMLSAQFSESFQDAAGLLALSPASTFGFDDEPEHIPAAGMLDASVTTLPTPSTPTNVVDDADDVLRAWALADSAPESTSLKHVIGPLREALTATLGDTMIDISWTDPELQIEVAASDLQVLIINMVLSARDSVGSPTQATITLDVEDINANLQQVRSDAKLRPGRYLTIHVSVRVESPTRSSIIGGFSTCEKLLRQVGGTLSASVERTGVVLLGRVPLTTTSQTNSSEQYTTKVVVLHPDPDIRETIIASLGELGITALDFSPENFEVARLEGASLLLADAPSLRDLRVLEPLIDARLVEIVRRGVDPMMPQQHASLRVPFALSELENLLD